MRVDPEVIQRFLQEIPARGRILDVGCGAGETLQGFLHLGYEAEGVDGNATLVETARARELPVQHRDFRLLSLKKEHYDAIWCHQAISHLSIDECHRLLGFFLQALKPQAGILFITFLQAPAVTAESPPAEAPTLPQGQARIYRHPVPAFLSLLRQSGFSVFLQGERQDSYAVFARRS